MEQARAESHDDPATETGTRLPWAAAGAVAGALGLAVAWVVTALVTGRVTPVEAIAETIVQITPGGVAEALIQLVGTWDKPLLLGGITLGALAMAAYAGVLYRRSQMAATLVVVGLALVAGAAVLTRPGAVPTDALPLAAGLVLWLVALSFLTAQLRHAVTDRRRFLLTLGSGAALAVAAGVAGDLLGASRRKVREARELLRLPVTRGTTPDGAELDVEGMPPWRVANADFYRIDTAIVLPNIDPQDWSLRIHGMVDTELVLSFDDLLARRLTEAWVTICCVSNEVGGDLIGNAWWSGVRVADLLAEAGVSPRADAVLQTSDDGWNCGTPLAALTDDRNALLAVAMNGEPLPVEHGFPVRTIVPGLYGYVSATKWVVDLEVTRFDRIESYWTQRGWSERGPVKTMSRIDVPRAGDDLPIGRRRVGGVAWAQQTGIAKVEYQLDGGPWQTAELGAVPGEDTWVQWAGEVEVTEGRHVLVCRATDKSGYTQTPVKRDVIPDGATGWHSRTFDGEI